MHEQFNLKLWFAFEEHRNKQFIKESACGECQERFGRSLMEVKANPIDS